MNPAVKIVRDWVGNYAHHIGKHQTSYKKYLPHKFVCSRSTNIFSMYTGKNIVAKLFAKWKYMCRRKTYTCHSIIVEKKLCALKRSLHFSKAAPAN
jgi:hypothetical protein